MASHQSELEGLDPTDLNAKPPPAEPRKAKTPLHISLAMLKQQVVNRVKGNRRFPFVMMLEPLYTCNLACLGCSVERHTGKLKDRLPVEKCLAALDACGAPLVSICGGEPTLYPELDELVTGIIDRKKHIYLCTNGLRLDKTVFGKVAPNPRLSINVHLDGLKETHDYVCNRKGVFDHAIEALKEAKALGYHTMINTTVFKETEVSEIQALCDLVTGIGVDGILVSPGYQYESVSNDVFLTRRDTQTKFREILKFADRYPITSTPMFLEFAAGERDYGCSPWSTVTFTPHGWKGPCYLIGEKFHQDWDSFWHTTDWSYWESRKDEKCANCAMHSGFEASAVMELHKSPRDLLRMARWSMG
ncbi:MAG: adenosyl-hopene transferase HpnH [Myxococcota bacterium]